MIGGAAVPAGWVRRLRWAALPAAAGLVAGLLAACAALPQGGPVRVGREGALEEEPYIRAVAAGPAEGASLDQIVEGFLQAMLAGATDDFKVARSYLAADIASVWDPSASVTVYQSGEAPVLAQSGTQLGRMTLTVNQVGSVDAAGRHSPGPLGAKTFTLHLSQGEDSEWRISELPDGTIIPEDVFRVDYLATPIHFPSADGQFLVPDRRVFPRQSAATDAAREFLAGPPPYLTGATQAVVPTGTKLATESVKVADGVATVNLNEAASRASETARAAMLACLAATLTHLPDIRSVELRLEGAELAVPGSGGLNADPPGAAGPFYLGDGGVWLFDGAARAVAGTEAATTWSSLSVDHSAKRFAGLAGGGFQVLQEPSGEVVEWKLPDGAAPTAPPSFDRLGSLWVAAGPTVAAFNSDGDIGVLGAPWLEGSQVVALAPSRDGARLALALDAGGGAVRLVVTGIVRGDGGLPWRLTGPLEVGLVASPVTSLSWCDG
ncbi:MAG: LpqB family beta-propeller domain-containing protein, partial [Bifidobacteriaceae bacterium]|nr:LpqB family beta-propeller domain-containing protein [Bifidobacteriaceae bacterium]